MSVSLRTTLVAVVFAVAALACAVLPTLADTPLGHTGKVGAHSLNDSTSSPGATCNYVYKSGNDAGKLKQIIVMPPNVRAIAGKSAQTVGWLFSVERRTQGIGGASNWVERYTSPEMTAVTNDAHDAAFTSASVPVQPGRFEAGGIFQYRVIVTTVW